jgi:hypothetical protein
MELQFEIPRSKRPATLFLAAVVLAIALWPLVERGLGIISPALGTEQSSEVSSWDLRAM